MTTSFFLVIANRTDIPALGLAGAAAPEVRLMTPADLSRGGWTLRLGDIAASTVVIGGEVVAASAIAGVLTRLAAVTAHDLPHIAASDRFYVAAEMTAFLLAWLTALNCPLVNRPTPQCLAGPAWRQERWLTVADRLSIPVRPVLRQAVLAKPSAAGAVIPVAPTTITIIGRGHVGEADATLIGRSHALADAAGADLLSVQFDGRGADARLVGVSLWPDLGDRVIAGAVLELLRGKAGHTSACPGEVGSGSPARTCADTKIYSASRSYWISG
jgi:hypothetical protein